MLKTCLFPLSVGRVGRTETRSRFLAWSACQQWPSWSPPSVHGPGPDSEAALSHPCVAFSDSRISKTRDPTLFLYHPAGRMVRRKPGWDLEQRLVSWHLTLPRPLRLQRVAGSPHLLHPPGASRVQRSPAQAPGSPEDLTQHLEKGPSLRAGGEGSGWLAAGP